MENKDVYIGSKLRNEIKRAGFTINNKKTRVQFKDSRQDVTGLIVNKKVNVKSGYWRITRAMCHELFMTGSFRILKESKYTKGNVHELEGRLNFIDFIDRYNHLHNRTIHSIEHKFVMKDSGLDYRKNLMLEKKHLVSFYIFQTSI